MSEGQLSPIVDQYGEPFLRVATIQGSVENPARSISEWDDELSGWLGGHATSSGLHVSRRRALCHAPVWRGVNLISSDVAKLPLFMYRREGEGKERATTHPAYKLLLHEPNQEQTAYDFRQLMQGRALLDGNAYAFIAFKGNGEPMALWPLDSEKTRPVRSGGELYYATTDTRDGTQETLFAWEVLHIRGFGNGIEGISLVQAMSESLGLDIAAQTYASRFFSNGAEPRIVIESPKAMSVEAAREFVRQWNEAHQGAHNSHKTAILNNGATAKTLSLSAKDAQLLEARRHGVREIANFLGVPPHKLGDDARVSYNSLEQENQSYLNDCLDHWLCQWEAECRKKLLTDKQKAADSHVVEFKRQALLRADMVSRANAYAIGITNGYLSRNEVRAMENLNPVDGLDDMLQPLNMAVVGEEPPEEEPADPPEQEQAEEQPPAEETQAFDRNRLLAALRRGVVDSVRRIVKRCAASANRAAKKPERFLEFIDNLRTEQEPPLAEMLEPDIAAIEVVRGGKPEITQVQVTDMLFAGLKEALLKAAECLPDELPARVEACMAAMEKSEPDAVADSLIAAEYKMEEAA